MSERKKVTKQEKKKETRKRERKRKGEDEGERENALTYAQDIRVANNDVLEKQQHVANRTID